MLIFPKQAPSGTGLNWALHSVESICIKEIKKQLDFSFGKIT